MTEKNIIVIPSTKTSTGTAERIEGSNIPVLPRLGEWYWLRVKSELSSGYETASEFRDAFVPEKHGKYAGRLLTCVTAVGSNFIEVSMQRPGRDHSTNWRVHLDTMDDLLVPAPEALDYIASRVAAHRSRATHLLAEIHELTRRLGVGMGDAALPAGGEPAAIVRASSVQPQEYKSALMKAQKEELPALFEKVKDANACTAFWMSVETLPLETAVERQFKPLIERIESRVFNVELYAGLVETVKQLTTGEPAPLRTPIHLMQRMHYMDEESLLDYDAGGMSFESIDEFDAWLARPANKNRLLPHDRCVVAFRVRRNKKQLELMDFDNLFEFINYSELARKMEKQTFLYLRNGEQLFRLSTEVQFNETLFPDERFRYLTGAVYAKEAGWDHRRDARSWHLRSEGDYLQTKLAYEQALADLPRVRAEAREAAESWLKSNNHALGFDATPPEIIDNDDGTWTLPPHSSEAFYVRIALIIKHGYSVNEALRVEVPDDVHQSKSSYRFLNEPEEERPGDQLFRLKDGTQQSYHNLYSSGRELRDYYSNSDRKEKEKKYPMLKQIPIWERIYHDAPRCPRAPTDELAGFELVSSDNVFIDDVMNELRWYRERHNRLVLILQGLLDRSSTFHPHPPWQLFMDDGFKEGLRLIHDVSRALAPTERPPDFEQFRAQHNVGLKVGSLVVGAHEHWQDFEAKYAEEHAKYNRYGDRQSGARDRGRGPGKIARVVRLTRDGAVFEWLHEKERYQRQYRSYMRVETRTVLSHKVPVNELLCIDNYQPGSYKQFFADPRTRADYLRWAPLLLTAENYAHGKTQVSEPPVGEARNSAKKMSRL